MGRRPAPGILGLRGEFEELRGHLVRALLSEPSVITVGTEPGVARTRPFDAAIDIAADIGYRVGTGRGRPPIRDRAFGVLHQMLDELLAPGGPWAASQARTVMKERPADEMFPVFDQLLARLAAHEPVLLALDDADLCDTASLRYLAHAMRRVHGKPVVLVLAHEETEPAVMDASLRELTATAHRIPAPGRSSPDTAAFLSRTAGPQAPDAATRDGLTPAPADIDEWLGARLSRHPASTTLAQAIAVLGDDADFGRAAALARLDLDDASARLDRLILLGLMDQTPPLRFRHHVLRAAVLDAVPMGARIAWHTRAAELLHEAGEPDETVAAHLLRADVVRIGWAATTLRSAARQAMGRGQPERAVPLLRRALTARATPAQRAAVLRELGTAELAFDHCAGIATLRAALENAPDADEAAHTALILVPALLSAESDEEATTVADQVAAWVAEADPDTAWHLGGLAYQGALGRLGTVSGAAARSVTLFADTPQDPRLRRARLAYLAHHHSWRGLDRPNVVRHATESLRDPRPGMAQSPYHLALLSLLYADALGNADAALRQLETNAVGKGSHCDRAAVMLLRGVALRMSGNLDTALNRFRTAYSLLDAWSAGNPTREGIWCLARTAETLVEQGGTEEANELLAQRGLLGELPDQVHYNWVLFARGRIHMALGDHEGALRDLLECGYSLTEWGMDNPAVLPWRSQAASSCLALGDRRRARELAEQELAAALRWGTPRTAGTARAALGRASTGPEATKQLTDAVAVLRESPARLELAHAQYALGVACRGQGRLNEAREHLVTAETLAQRCGAGPLAVRAAKELAGINPPSGSDAPWGPLTRQQRRVAELAAQHLSNRQIAVQLDITVRCVEFHLSAAYRKLGISGRHELRRVLGISAGG
ncbi:LuxR C-terminal-related transcriptional regulator [Streptomyces griseochromogenes]|uniref:LuxR C-terminal-related transcriptional regulator n=1 Tax=Streptomyces griseochromogenes TaxID=68214 RepID=UPI0037A2E402